MHHRYFTLFVVMTAPFWPAAILTAIAIQAVVIKGEECLARWTGEDDGAQCARPSESETATGGTPPHRSRD